METFQKKITVAYEMARVRGMFDVAGIDPAALPKLAQSGLAGMPISALHLAPAVERHLAANHILSVDTLCQLTPEFLSGESIAHKVPRPYVVAIAKKLDIFGLRLGMTDEARAHDSQLPPEALVNHYPAFRRRVDSGPKKLILEPSPRINVPVQALPLSVALDLPTRSDLPDFITQPARWKERIKAAEVPSQASEIQEDRIAAEMQPWLHNLGYVNFSFSSTARAQQFFDQTTGLFRSIIKADPVAARRCSSNTDVMSHPAFLLSREADSQPFTVVAMSRDMLHVLANEMSNHADLVPVSQRMVPALPEPKQARDNSPAHAGYDHFGALVSTYISAPHAKLFRVDQARPLVNA